MYMGGHINSIKIQSTKFSISHHRQSKKVQIKTVKTVDSLSNKNQAVKKKGAEIKKLKLQERSKLIFI